jgi:hypothetical protein
LHPDPVKAEGGNRPGGGFVVGRDPPMTLVGWFDWVAFDSKQEAELTDGPKRRERLIKLAEPLSWRLRIYLGLFREARAYRRRMEAYRKVWASSIGRDR